MDERARHLLKSLIEQHIAKGVPVGSRQLARDAGLNISPATVRNVMADLEDEGYLISPHTSAGRIPTRVGYRFFVDALLRVVPLSAESNRLLIHRIGFRAPDVEQVLHAATGILSELTHMAG
nr:heat-inducible transcription repressor HrcA [Acidithiobacillus ferridurans]